MTSIISSDSKQITLQAPILKSVDFQIKDLQALNKGLFLVRNGQNIRIRVDYRVKDGLMWVRSVGDTLETQRLDARPLGDWYPLILVEVYKQGNHVLDFGIEKRNKLGASYIQYAIDPMAIRLIPQFTIQDIVAWIKLLVKGETKNQWKLSDLSPKKQASTKETSTKETSTKETSLVGRVLSVHDELKGMVSVADCELPNSPLLPYSTLTVDQPQNKETSP